MIAFKFALGQHVKIPNPQNLNTMLAVQVVGHTFTQLLGQNAQRRYTLRSSDGSATMEADYVEQVARA